MTEDQRRRTIRQKLANQTGSARDSLPTPIGPLPRGAIVELSGPPASGKTTLALEIVASLQARNLSTAWIDAEHTFDLTLARHLAIATETLPVLQPESAEQAFEIMRRLVASQALDLVVVDSAAALVPELELQSAIGEAGRGLQSRVLASGLRRLAGAVVRTETCVLFLNQTRTGRDESETTAGGAPLKLHAALRIAINPVTEGRIRLRVVKNKTSTAFSPVEFALRKGPRRTESP